MKFHREKTYCSSRLLLDLMFFLESPASYCALTYINENILFLCCLVNRDCSSRLLLDLMFFLESPASYCALTYINENILFLCCLVNRDCPVLS